MHLLLLGLILVVGILVYYIMTTSAGGKGASSDRKESSKSKVSENLRKEDNVIFLPTADGTGDVKTDNAESTGDEPLGDDDQTD